MIVNEYLSVLQTYQKKFGKHVYLMYMVGSFYEAYAKTKDEYNSLCEICNKINLAVIERKSKTKHFMAGFHISSLDKYRSLLLKHGYTAVQFDQVADPSKPGKYIRKHVKTYSQTTSLTDCSDDTNWFMTVHIEYLKVKSSKYIYGAGICLVDLCRGTEVIFHERQIQVNNNENIEELRDIVQLYNPKEVMFVLENAPLSYGEQLKSWLGLTCKSNMVEIDKLPKIVRQVSLQVATLKKIYMSKIGDCCPLTKFGLVRLPRALLAIVASLYFIEQHDPLLLDNINIPKPYQSDKYLTTHYIIDRLQIKKITNTHKFGSVYNILVSKIITAMGRRYLKKRLSKPKIKIADIKDYYREVEVFIKSKKVLKYQNLFQNISDIDRLYRKMSLKMISPLNLQNLHKSHLKILQLISSLSKTIHKTFSIPSSLANELKSWNLTLESIFVIDDLTKEHFFKVGVHPEIDALIKHKKNITDWMHTLAAEMGKVIDKNVPGMVKLERNDRDGYYFQMTKKRFGKFSEDMEFNVSSKTLPCKVSIDDFKIDKSKANYIKLKKGVMTNVSDMLLSIDMKLRYETKRAFNQTMLNVWDGVLFQQVVSLIGRLDVALGVSIVSRKFNYCQPKIIDKDFSFVKTEALRHPISERVNTNINFVSYSFDIGNDEIGMMLTSPNGSGKSVLLKSLGVAVYMAQCGFYVSAKKFEFSPYHHLACRAGHFDNLLQGESTYTMEMKELQRMLGYASNRSLFLLDEVAASTEYASAFGIQVGIVNMLCEKKSNFVFATHVKGLEKREEIKKHPEVQFWHMNTQYNQKLGKFVYEYDLKRGVEDRYYGLEVLNGIIEDSTLKRIAFQVRDDIVGDRKALENIRLSRYNAKVSSIQCAICGDKGTKEPLDTHHIIEQCTSNNGLVQECIPVHSKSNLVTLCKKHHRAVHKKGPKPHYNIVGYRKLSDGTRYLEWNKC